MQLTHFDIDRFLADHWQKRPALIRNPWGQWRNPLEPDELAGLACEDGVESRLITLQGEGLSLENGPLPETRFGAMGRSPWTLLVQAVDQYVPDVAALIEPFRFVPDWRIDDVMVSYAVDGGGVGAHYDQYDVFLVQGLGRRRWRVGPLCDADTPLLPHDDLRLLADFTPTDEWVLEPGDILYVPPRFGHDGVAVGDDCMTYSIGFRAPSRAELIDDWSAHQADAYGDEDRYEDPDLTRQDNAGEIRGAAIDRLHGMMMDALSDRAAFARWFGQYNSQPKYAEADWRPEEPVAREDVRALIAAGIALARNPASRLSFIRGDEGAVMLFADGVCFDCAGDMAALAVQICAEPTVLLDPALAGSGPAITLVTALLDQGSLAFEEE
ncbi:JmjC domain-containing protein [Sphingobium sp.]|uniref:JmjC domain-containing protein n=1 Tax=Sphingobium sp. TaxID=1912891 RepID=UPI003BB809BC